MIRKDSNRGAELTRKGGAYDGLGEPFLEGFGTWRVGMGELEGCDLGY